jgi:hypothetical protein
MTNTQLYLAIGVPLLTNLLAIIGLAKYMDAKLEPINSQLKFVVDNMMLHHGKIATLEERTKNL